MTDAHIKKAPIFAISRLRMGTDGPGVTTLVTFMRCPLRCKYCLNKKCQEPIFEKDSANIRKGIMMLTPKELFDLVKIDNLYFQTTGGGICFGGGEPTLYPEFIEEFRKLCRDKWKITIETSLYCSLDTICRLSKVVDNWIVDIKSLNPQIYQSYTERESKVTQTLAYLQNLVPDSNVRIKVPHIPGFTDDVDLEADIEQIKNDFGFTNVHKTEYITR